MWEHTCVDTLVLFSVGISEHGSGCSSSGVEGGGDRKVHGKKWRNELARERITMQEKKTLEKTGYRLFE